MIKREEYRGYIIAQDNLGRAWIYNTESPYSEEIDMIRVRANTNKECREIVDIRLEFGVDYRG